jgi:hypothetical protein
VKKQGRIARGPRVSCERGGKKGEETSFHQSLLCFGSGIG